MSDDVTPATVGLSPAAEYVANSDGVIHVGHTRTDVLFVRYAKELAADWPRLKAERDALAAQVEAFKERHDFGWTERVAAELATARETNRRLNERCQRAEAALRTATGGSKPGGLLVRALLTHKLRETEDQLAAVARERDDAGEAITEEWLETLPGYYEDTQIGNSWFAIIRLAWHPNGDTVLLIREDGEVVILRNTGRITDDDGDGEESDIRLPGEYRTRGDVLALMRALKPEGGPPC